MNKVLIKFIIFGINCLNAKFGFVLENCSELFINKPNQKNNISKYVLSENGSNLNLRIIQANYGEILKINEPININSNYYSIKSEFFNYFDKDKKNLLNNYLIEKKNIKIISEKEFKIYKNSILYDKKAFLKKSFNKKFLIGKMLFFKKENKKSKYLKCYYFDKNFKKKYIKLKKSHLEIRENISYKNEFIKENNKRIRKKIINFLESLTKNKNKIIPYIYGGTTIGSFSNKNFFKKEKLNFHEKEIIFYKKKNLKDKNSGIDCSGLVNITFRLFGIPFNLRNTETFSKILKPVNFYENLEDGDLIWIPNHVFIIDKKNNILYESVGYKSGYGGIVKNKISNRFFNINSIEEVFFANELILKPTNTKIKNFLFLKSF